MEKINRWISHLEKIQTFLISLMLLTFFTPYPKNFYSYVLACSLVVAVVRFFLHPKDYWLKYSTYKPFVPYIALYVLFLISAFYSQSVSEGFSMCGKWFSLLLIPLVFIGMGTSYFRMERIRKFSIFLVLGCFIEALAKCIAFVYIFLNDPELEAIRMASGWLKAANIFLGYQNYYVGHLIMHTTFEAMFLNLAFVMVLYNWLKGYSFFRPWKVKVFAFVILLVFFVVLVTSNSKAGQIMFALSVIGSILQVVQSHSYRYGFIYLAVLLAVGVPFFSFLGQGIVARMTQSFDALSSYHQHVNLEDDGSSLPRIYCWQVAFDMIKDKPVFGVGVGSRSVYKAEFAKQIEYRNIYDHPHNQFLNLWLANGIIGLSLFIWALFSAFLLVLKRRSVLWWIWLLSILLVCMTDTFFNSVYAFLFLIGGYGVLHILCLSPTSDVLKPLSAANFLDCQ